LQGKIYIHESRISFKMSKTIDIET